MSIDDRRLDELEVTIMPQPYSSRELYADVVSLMANIGTNEDKGSEIAISIATKVSQGHVKLVELVVSLRDFITSEDQNERQRALHCLSRILSELPKDTLLKNDVAVILDFLLGKFDDISCLKEVLFGISSIVDMKCFYSNQISTVLKPLKEEYQPTQHLAATRYFAFLTLQRLIQKFQKAFLENPALNNLFIETFLSVAAGEKDPRNLLISFRLNSKISTELQNISSFKEDLFDTLFCYFPITFKPPKNDPYKITNSDLKLALRTAISASALFEEDAFGNLIDKMTASSPSVKNDTLLTIKACIEKFGGEACLKNWLPIWNALKFEIMHNVEDSSADGNALEFDNYEDSLSVLTSLSTQLVGYKEGAFDKFYRHIFEELKPNFKYEKDLKQSSATLSAIAKANPVTFEKVLSDVLTLFFQDVNNLDVNKLKLLILNLSFFFDAYIRVFNNYASEDKTIPKNKLMEFKDEILMVLSKSLKGASKSEVTLRTLSVVQLTKLIKMPGYLSDEEICLIVQYFTETILTDDNKNLYFACLEGLKATCEVSEHSVLEVSLNQMLGFLQKKSAATLSLDENEQVPVERILKVILDFTTSRHKLVVESICGISNAISEFSRVPDETEYCFMLISGLYSLFDNNQEVLSQEVALKLKATVEASLLSSASNDAIFYDNHNLVLISSVLFFLNVKTPKSGHQAEVDKYIDLFVNNSKILCTPKRSAITFVKLLSAFDKDCVVPAESLMLKCIDLLYTESASYSEFEKLAYLELLAVLCNKWCTDEAVTKALDIKGSQPIYLEVTAWCTKGLAMKNSKLAVTFINRFIDLLADHALGSRVAQLFEILVIDIPTLDKLKGISWNNNVKLLYKQKLFGDVVPQLTSAYGSTNDMLIKANYLMALSLLLKNTHRKITINYIGDLLALLLQAVKLNNSEVRVSALVTIKNTIDQAPQLITEHVHSLIPLLVQLIRPGNYNSYLVRLTALEILQDFTQHVPLNYLLPFKEQVITELAVALDDKKRKVRKTCIDTRQAYFDLGQVPFE